eukprot:1373431-Rhodomonas_salina.6
MARRRYAFGLVTHRVFEVFITTAILCNVVVMAMKRHDQSQCFAAGLFWANLVFSCIYFVEAVLKVKRCGQSNLTPRNVVFCFRISKVSAVSGVGDACANSLLSLWEV